MSGQTSIDHLISQYFIGAAVSPPGLTDLAGTKRPRTEDEQPWRLPTEDRAEARLQRPVAVLIDNSAGRAGVLDQGWQIVHILRPLCDSGLYAYALEKTAFRPGPEAPWAALLSPDPVPTGDPAAAFVVQAMRIKGERAEQFVLITPDQVDVAATFADSVRAYGRAMGVKPTVCIVCESGSGDTLEQRCRDLDIPVDACPFLGDARMFPSLARTLARRAPPAAG